MSELLEKLKAPFPEGALKAVPGSAGLTSIKPQYIIERLVECFGMFGWRIVEKEYRDTPDDVLFFGELLIKEDDEVMQRIPMVGGSSKWISQQKGMKRDLIDAYKGARTDALSKAASYLLIGNDVFKRMVEPTKAGARDFGKATIKFGPNAGKKYGDLTKAEAQVEFGNLSHSHSDFAQKAKEYLTNKFKA